MVPSLSRNAAMRRLLLLIAISAAMLGAVHAIPLGDGRAPALQHSAPGSAHGLNDSPPTEAERHAMIDRIFANQLADEASLAIFQRIEHHQIREHPSDVTPLKDEVVRVVPTGTGSWRVLVEDHGHPLSAADYQSQIANLERALEQINDPANSDMRRAREKFNARMKSRSELIASVRDAFVFNWIGRESLNGRILDKFHLDPNPKYKPSSIETELLLHCTATIWVDETTSHVARIEGELTSDFAVGGGVLGKFYHGARLTLGQTEVAPGIWLPSFYQYDYSGRKFLFKFEAHERTEASKYERVGPPSEALAFIRRELTPVLAPHAQ